MLGPKLCMLVIGACFAMTGISVADTTPTTAQTDVVAEVNGRKISRQEYYDRLERTPTGEQNAQVEAGMITLRDLINEELLLRLAEKEKVSPTDAQVNERHAEMQKQPQFQARIKQTGLGRDQAKDLVRILQAHFNLLTRGISIPEKDVKAYYDEYRSTQFTIAENADVCAIFSEKKADATKAMQLLKKGVDFSTVARQLSSDEGSKAAGGRLGRPVYADDPALPPKVWKTVLATKEGKYTQPIADETGYAIFKVIRHNPPKVQTFEEVKFLLWEGMMREQGDKKWDIDAELNKFRETADIKIMIDRYRDQLLPKQPTPGSPGYKGPGEN